MTSCPTCTHVVFTIGWTIKGKAFCLFHLSPSGVSPVVLLVCVHPWKFVNGWLFCWTNNHISFPLAATLGQNFLLILVLLHKVILFPNHKFMPDSIPGHVMDTTWSGVLIVTVLDEGSRGGPQGLKCWHLPHLWFSFHICVQLPVASYQLRLKHPRNTRRPA